LSRCTAFLISIKALHGFFMRYILICFIALHVNVYSTLGYSKDLTDTTLANRYYSLGDSLFNTGHYSEAIDYFNKARPIYKMAGDWQKLSSCYNHIADSFIRTGKFEEAAVEAKESLQICMKRLPKNSLQEGYAYRIIATTCMRKSEYSAALEYYRKALNILVKLLGDKHTDVGEIYMNKGSLYFYMDNLPLSYENSVKGLLIFKKNLGEKHIFVARAYNNIGIVYYEKGDYLSAQEYFIKSAEIRKQLYNEGAEMAVPYMNMAVFFEGKGDYSLALEYNQKALNILDKTHGDQSHRATIYHNIGNIYILLNDYNTALEYHQKASTILKQLFGEKSHDVASSYFNLGIIYKNLHNNNKALECCEKSISIGKEILGENHTFLINAYFGAGNVYKLNGNEPKALVYYEKALGISKKLFGEKHPTNALIYNLLGDLYYEKRDYTQALNYFQKGIIANVVSFNSVEPQINPFLNNYLDQKVLLESLTSKGKAWMRHYVKAKNLESLKASLQTYLVCDSLTDIMRQSHRNHVDKIELGKSAVIAYEGIIEAYLSMFEVTRDLSYKKLAFYFSEKSKATTLTNALLDTDAKHFGQIPDDLLSREKELRVDISYYQSRIREENSTGVNLDTTKIRDLEDVLFRANRSYDSLVTTLENNYPKYYQLKYQNNIIGIDELQQKLDDKTVLLEYFSGENNTYTFVITKTALNYVILDSVGSFDQSIKEFRNTVDPLLNKTASLKLFTSYTTQAFELYKKIIQKPLRYAGNKEKLIVIPDGPLGYIPFDVLLTKPAVTDQIDYRTLPYLLYDFKISYAYSASLLFNNILDKKRYTRSNFIAFAPVYKEFESDSIKSTLSETFRNKLTALSWNQQEIKNIDHYLDGDILIGDDAQESNFKNVAHKYDIIHLAMHALIDDQNPMYSKLAFTGNKNDSINDGFLNAYELYNMELSAEMVVLSACETGYGKLEKGEGIMSLARAFTYAGCPSIVMSHWLADDKATAELMDLFYKYLAEGLSKDEALQKAKIEFLKNTDDIRQNPAFWAGFVVLGDTSPINKRSIFEKFGIPITGGLLILIILIWIYARRKQ